MKTRRLMMAVAMTLVCMGSIAQEQRIKEFQELMSKYETPYRDFIKSGNHKEAITPLKTLINILDTTTICQVTPIPQGVIKESKAFYYYDLACCYALTKQKKQAMQALEQSVDLGYKDYKNMLNDNDLVSLRKDKKYQALLAEVKVRRPLGILQESAPYAKDEVLLVLCETANWNHESQQTKEYYLDEYMAKNLYYFVCKKISRFNPESVYRDNPPEGDIRLIPVGFVNNNWKCDTTTDSDFFWAKPE